MSAQRETVCTLAEAVAHLNDKRPKKIRQAEPHCDGLVLCRCNIWSCCVCVYAKAHHVCRYVSEPKPCHSAHRPASSGRAADTMSEGAE